MMTGHSALERRVVAALDASPPRIPVLLGGCGTGRTGLLCRVREQLGRSACQYVDLERIATTPERCLASLTAASPFPVPPPVGFGTTRQAFDHILAVFEAVRAPGGSAACFLLDEFLELRTFESFPGLRSVLRDLLAALERSPNRFVLASRYAARAHRLLRESSSQFEIIHMPPLTAIEVRTALTASLPLTDAEADDLARATHALTGGRPAYVHLLIGALRAMTHDGPGDPVSALAAQFGVDGALQARCRQCYELRLHRARGYGALKAILDILAETEPLSLTEIAQRLQRTPGSTKDYLSWLEDVDLVAVRQKRYAFPDPVLRLWVRLNGSTAAPSDDDVVREVQAYALARLPHLESAYAATVAPDAASINRSWGIIEID